MNAIAAENHPRQFYFYDCESIEFRSMNSDNTLTTLWRAPSGEGEINLPIGVSVLVLKGKIKSG
jgi:hypothetical protein